MESERIYTWVSFLFCLGLAAAGILIFFKEKSIRSFKPVLLLQYFLILIYTFGFYSIWSGIFYRLALEPGPGKEGEVPSFLALIGMPFLLTGLIILVLWAFRFSVKKSPVFIYSGGFILSAAVMFLFFLLQDFNWRQDIQRLYAIIWISVVLITCFFLSVSGVRHIAGIQKIILILLLLISGIVQLPIFFLNDLQVFQPGFAFLFFLTNTGFCLFFVYAVKPYIEQEGKNEEAKELITEADFISFFKKFEITPRESEVIMEIYRGKTNKEIADKLFVTVQTIKDHTHRIYQKTNIKNRTLLASELRKYQSQP